MEYMEKNSLHNPRQHGFRPGRSCLSQLLDHFDRVLEGTQEGQFFDVPGVTWSWFQDF